MSTTFSSAPASSGHPRHLSASADPTSGQLTVTGELDRTSARHLLDAVEDLLLGDQPAWTVDVAGVTFCDAEGLRALVRARSLARSRGVVLRIGNPSPLLADLLPLVGLHRPVDRVPTQAARPQPDGRVRGRTARVPG